MKTAVYVFLIIIMILPSVQGRENDHSLFTAVLKTHVKNGKVNYAALKNDKRLDRYTAFLSATNPYTIAGKQNQLAFWINAYNAFTLQIVCRNYPVKSIKDIGSVFKSVWNQNFIRLKGREYSLNDIEHKIIRVRYNDPRIHFALVCAAKSCPPLRPEAYVGSRLDKQLNDQGKKFLRNRLLNRFNVAEKKVFLSSIFKWYRKDFPRSDRDFLVFLARFINPEEGRAVKRDPPGWEIDFLRYDWRLNRR